MTKKLEVYKCEVCGNMVEVVHEGAGQLVCCGQPMKNLVENTTDAAKEKHVPAIEKAAHGIVVKVGSVAHPMTPEHFIEWIQVIFKSGRTTRVFLNPGQAPEAAFPVDEDYESVREYCNLHGLWKA
ncbi:MAG TPA: desulfoferrodoxin [Spirochaetota bacterium]|nr:desulfoferrodoxin [Spirochaetota bacterium]HNT09870.1 desulfoferrodoxin [Spirochaetota bacterium]HNV46279.1 desulfoferrodoxin [Spirochaetota bacterium]HPI23159.1 desulfoferrodoxin [Spirochaetota bacterium]HPU87125.1 desulfoferrodoxin [Spirochaetota bacterium]